MPKFAHPIPTALKAIGLITASSVLGVYMGYSAIGQIDPFYYTPQVHGTRYVPSPTHPQIASYAGAPAVPYEVDYPYASKVVAPEPGVEPGSPVELLPNAAYDVAANSNLRIASAPGTTPEPQPACHDCGGPHEESPAEPPAEALPDEVPGSSGMTPEGPVVLATDPPA